MSQWTYKPINSCHRLNWKDNRMKISIKLSRKKRCKVGKSGWKVPRHHSFYSCSKLLWLRCKKWSVQIIYTQVCSIISEEKLMRRISEENLPCYLWVCFDLLATFIVFPCYFSYSKFFVTKWSWIVKCNFW